MIILLSKEIFCSIDFDFFYLQIIYNTLKGQRQNMKYNIFLICVVTKVFNFLAILY